MTNTAPAIAIMLALRNDARRRGFMDKLSLVDEQSGPHSNKHPRRPHYSTGWS